jgi:hypothetical protein
MKNYDGILILEPEDTYTSFGPDGENRLSIRGGMRPMYEATMVIAKRFSGELLCLKSRDRYENGYSQEELQETIDRCEGGFDKRVLLML